MSARPSPQCRSLFITEIGYSYKLNPPLQRTYIQMYGDSKQIIKDEVSGRHYLISELGLMRNLNPHYGPGFTHFFG